MSAHERERLCGYLDEELSAVERAEVEAHLAGCAECRERLAAMAAVDEAATADGSTSGLPSQVPDGYFDDFARRVRSRLETEAVHAATPPARRLPAWSWAIAAALLLAVVTPLTLRERAGHPAEPRVAREVPATTPAATRPPATSPGPARPAPGLAAAGSGGGAATDPASRPTLAAPAAATPAAATPAAATPAAPASAAAPAAPGVPAEAKPFLRERDAAGPVGRQKQSQVPAAQATAAGEDTLAPARAEAVLPESPVVAAQAAQGQAEERVVSRNAVLGAASQDESEREFRILVAQGVGGLEDCRSRRERWRAFVAAHPDSPRADEARVQVIAAGLAAARAGGGAVDRATLEQDAARYLARGDARQRPRVRALLDEAAKR